MRSATDSPRYEHSELTKEVIGAAIEVHRCLGPGLLESAYRICLVHELRQRGVTVQTEVDVPVRYKGVALPGAYRADLIVNGAVLIELKAVDDLAPIHGSQVLTYLRFLGLRIGLLMNFNTPTLRQGLRRLVL